MVFFQTNQISNYWNNGIFSGDFYCPKNALHTIGDNMKQINQANYTKILVQKPEEMEMVKWEKIIIKLTTNFRPLGVIVRRLSDDSNKSK